MKIKEAMNIINSTNTASAATYDDELRIYEPTLGNVFNWFIKMPIKGISWANVQLDSAELDDVLPADLARIMDVVQRLIDTPIKERFLEEKYVLSAMRCAEGPVPVKQYVNAMKTSTNNVEFHFGFADEKADAMEFTQKELDDLSDFFPKDAIDAMKEPVEDIADK